MSGTQIVFDSQIFCAQQFGGISRYFASVAREMSAMPEVRPLIVAPLYINDYVGRLPHNLVWGRKIKPGKARVALGAASAIFGEMVQFARSPDIVHETYYYPQPRAPRRARTVVSVYDMTYERYPENFPKDDPIPGWKRKAVARADHVICISEHTRRDLLELCDVAPEKVSVTYLGYDSLAALLTSQTPAEVRTRFCGSDRPYLLYVGSRTGCKNFPALIRAFAASAWLKGNFTLLCFGGGAFTAEEQAMLARANVTAQVRWANGPDATLADCYRHAAAFVYPSLYEGFGIPPLEAMSLDCPVVCSSASSIPEVVGDAAVTFDPSDADAIKAALERVLGSETLRAELVARGRERRELFSWLRCATETLGIYRKMLES
jgi:glycosyltransferase involved in cell wall biosynthesis